ncbi:MAG TPA: hypothetical protein VE988_13100 [Gemmataceae bacterium]|nr:hypothetical protein [Gemmataceae bacterium]
MILTLVLLTFVVTCGLWLALLAIAFRRVASHLQGRPAAVEAVTEHVLLPLLGRKRDEAEKKKPVPRDARLC